MKSPKLLLAAVAVSIAFGLYVAPSSVIPWKWPSWSGSHSTSASATKHAAEQARPAANSAAPTQQCVSGLQQEGKDYATLHTPDCSNLKNPIGTKSIVAWLQQHRGEASAVYVAIFTFTDPDIKNELIAMQKSGVQVYVMLDYNQLQSVGNVADKKAAEALKNPGATNNTGTKKRRSKTPKQSEHMIANDLCTAGAQVVWGYSPDGHSIMHLKRIIIFDKQGKPHWEEDGSFNFTVAANWEANDLGFDDDPADAAKDFAQWTYLHDQMLAQNKPFYSTDLGLPQACPTLDKVPYAAKH